MTKSLDADCGNSTDSPIDVWKWQRCTSRGFYLIHLTHVLLRWTTGSTKYCHEYLASKWVLGRWTSIFKLVEQVLYPMDHLPSSEWCSKSSTSFVSFFLKDSECVPRAWMKEWRLQHERVLECRPGRVWVILFNCYGFRKPLVIGYESFPVTACSYSLFVVR